MANQYLVDIHKFISAKIEIARRARQEAASEDAERINYFQGQR